MGLFDKIKKMKNYLTGGGAKLTVQAIEPKLQEPFTVKVHAVIEEEDIDIQKVYVKLRGIEEVTIRDSAVLNKLSEGGVQRSSVSDSTSTANVEIPATGPLTLQAGQEYDWEVTVDLPSGSLPTYNGRNATHKWSVLAGLDKKGNDPDSGWQEITVY